VPSYYKEAWPPVVGTSQLSREDRWRPSQALCALPRPNEKNIRPTTLGSQAVSRYMLTAWSGPPLWSRWIEAAHHMSRHAKKPRQFDVGAQFRISALVLSPAFLKSYHRPVTAPLNSRLGRLRNWTPALSSATTADKSSPILFRGRTWAASGGKLLSGMRREGSQFQRF
jgi:hypothetical protein